MGGGETTDKKKKKHMGALIPAVPSERQQGGERFGFPR